MSDKILEWGLLSWCVFWATYAFLAQSWFSLVLNGILVLYWGNLTLRHFVYERASSASTKAVYQRVMEQLPRFVDKAMPTRAVMAPDGMSFLLVLWNKPIFP